jgi:hypothetical protein
MHIRPDLIDDAAEIPLGHAQVLYLAHGSQIHRYFFPATCAEQRHWDQYTQPVILLSEYSHTLSCVVGPRRLELSYIVVSCKGTTQNRNFHQNMWCNRIH